MVHDLPAPGAELAERLLGTVPFEQQLMGSRLNPMRGSVRVDLRTLNEAASFMETAAYEEIMDPRAQANIGYVDPVGLALWIETVFGDTGLAEAVREVAAGVDSYAAAVGPVRELVLGRLKQCEQLLAAEGTTDEPVASDAPQSDGEAG